MKQFFFNKVIKNTIILTSLLGSMLFYQHSVYSQTGILRENFKAPKIISYDPASDQYQGLLDGEKDSVAFYSGFVTLEPNSRGELHSTEEYEEMIIVLQGEGQLNITNQESLKVSFGKVAYVPPHTEHQMKNTGREIFKYIYVATQSNHMPSNGSHEHD